MPSKLFDNRAQEVRSKRTCRCSHGKCGLARRHGRTLTLDQLPSPESRDRFRLPDIMRPQARPFTVEIKTRKRPTEPATASSFVSDDDWVDLVPPDGLPERDVQADLLDAPSSEARPKAEKLFSRFAGNPKPVPTQAAREAPVAATPKRKRATKGSRIAKLEQPPRTAAAVRVIDPPAQPCPMSNGHAEAALALSRQIRRPGVPPAQRWRERRLPKACWVRRT